MAKHSIATIINFCSNEAPFLKPCLKEALKFSKKVYVVVADRFFDGVEEEMALLNQFFKAHSQVQFLLYPYMPVKMNQKSSLYQQVGEANFWHSLSRLIGFSHVDSSIEYTLFLDVDEIADGDLFQRWLDTNEYQKYTVLRPANYWYFRESCYQAEKFEDSAVLVQNQKVNLSSLLQKSEREALFDDAQEPKIRNVLFENKPLIHHYSWVRTKEQMVKKIKSWGHKNDRPWSALIEKEFTSEFKGKDFVHGYDFIKVKPFCKIDLAQDFLKAQKTTPESNGIRTNSLQKKPANVRFLSIKEVLSLVKKSSKVFAV